VEPEKSRLSPLHAIKRAKKNRKEGRVPKEIEDEDEDKEVEDNEGPGDEEGNGEETIGMQNFNSLVKAYNKIRVKNTKR
jgi:hypothetical protein